MLHYNITEAVQAVPISQAPTDLNLTVINSVMGSGKSTWAISTIYSDVDNRYIVVVPTLAEVDRYKTALSSPAGTIPGRQVYTTSDDDLSSRFGLQECLKGALTEQQPVIITTHRMLEVLDDESLDLIRKGKYTLILDEVTDVITPYDECKERDVQVLVDAGLIRIEPLYNGIEQIIVNQDKDNYWLEGGKLKFHNFMTAVRSGTVYRVKGSFIVCVAMPHKLAAFSKLIILTYMFHESIMEAWFNYHEIGYRTFSVDKGRLSINPPEGGLRFKDLVIIEQDKALNAIGTNIKALSASAYRHNRNGLRAGVKKNLGIWFRKLGLSAEYVCWAVYKEFRKQIAPKGYKTTVNGLKFDDRTYESWSAIERAEKCCFITVNLKGTNLYRHKQAVAYLANIHSYPGIDQFFTCIGKPFNADRYALSELIQVIWRAQVRDELPIHVYVPSRRMRELLETWLAAEFVTFY